MGFFDRIERSISTGLGVLGDVAAGIGGGLIDIGQQVGGQIIEQLPGAILGGILPGPAPPRQTVFTPTGAPTTRVPEPFIAPRVPRSAFIPPGVTPIMQEDPVMPAALALPGGAPIAAGLAPLAGAAGRVIPRILTGLGTLGGLSELGEFFGGGEEAAMATAGALFRPTATTIRPARVVVVPHPQTGAPTFFGHLGRPLLFSRDLSAARRVDRLARRARRVKRGR